MGEGNYIRLLAGRGLLPLVKIIDRHQAPAALKGKAERRPVLDLSGDMKN
jgi:hypothetical protein